MEASDWWTKQWTLFFPDGRKAVGTGDKLQHLFDANNNGVHFNNYCDDVDCDMPSTVILDDTNPTDDISLPTRRVTSGLQRDGRRVRNRQRDARQHHDNGTRGQHNYMDDQLDGGDTRWTWNHTYVSQL